MTILEEIFRNTRLEVEQRRRVKPLDRIQAEVEMARPPLDFIQALRSQQTPLRQRSQMVSESRPDLWLEDAAHPVPALIAEIKFASPSKGILTDRRDPVRMARIYQENGASAISVLTDERYFKGSLDFLLQVAGATPRLPVLRKDFICDEYQVFEARAAGADAVLLIVAGLELGQLIELHEQIVQLGMTALVEVHSRHELDIALRLDPALVGINNRDLRTFEVSLETTLRLRPYVPDHICLAAESGIQTYQDACSLANAGVDAMLVGEALVTARDTGAKIRELLGGNA